jgi:F-type H+-transporting ATPase subunit b
VLSTIGLLAAEETKNPLLPALNELVWGTISLALLLLILWRTGVFRNIRTALGERTERIQGELERAEHERQEAQALLERYREQLAEARQEAARILEEARKNAENVRRDLLARAEADASRVVERASEEIQGERNRAISEIRGEAAALALDLAGRVIGESMDDERHRRLVERYIEQVGPRGEG